MRYTVPGLLPPCDWSAGVTWPAPGFWLVETESRSTELRPSTPMLSISSESSLKISRIYESLDSLVYHRFPIKYQQKIFYFPSSFCVFSLKIYPSFDLFHLHIFHVFKISEYLSYHLKEKGILVSWLFLLSSTISSISSSSSLSSSSSYKISFRLLRNEANRLKLGLQQKWYKI